MTFILLLWPVAEPMWLELRWMCQLSGCLSQDLIEAIEPYNLMWPTGHIGSVGVAGEWQNKASCTNLKPCWPYICHSIGRRIRVVSHVVPLAGGSKAVACLLQVLAWLQSWTRTCLCGCMPINIIAFWSCLSPSSYRMATGHAGVSLLFFTHTASKARGGWK